MLRLDKIFTAAEFSKMQKFPALQTKDDFIKLLKTNNKFSLSSVYGFAFNGNAIYVVKSVTTNSNNASFKFQYVDKYEPSSPEMLEYLKELLLLKEENSISLMSSNSFNSYSIICNSDVLDVILSRKEIEIKGEVPFNTFPHKSKNGKVREITAPHEDIKKPLQRLNGLLQCVYDRKTAEFQVAYKRGKNVKSGAKLHTNHNYIYNIDLKDFYPSCKREVVKKYTDFLFNYSFNRSFIENEFLDSILKDDGLFIGSPISGTLANAIVSKPATFLRNICHKYGMEFSIYADDMTFSSDKFIVFDFVKQIFDLAFAEYGLNDYFKLNEKKSVGYSNHKRKITGVSINHNNQITVSRKYFRNIRVQIDHLAHNDATINVNKLRGKIAYATEIDDSGKVFNYLNKYLNTVKQFNLCSDEKMKELESKFGGK